MAPSRSAAGFHTACTRMPILHRLRVDLAQHVHDAGQRRRAVDLDHCRDQRLGDALHVPGHVAQRERVHRAGVLSGTNWSIGRKHRSHTSRGGTTVLPARRAVRAEQSPSFSAAR